MIQKSLIIVPLALAAILLPIFIEATENTQLPDEEDSQVQLVKQEDLTAEPLRPDIQTKQKSKADYSDFLGSIGQELQERLLGEKKQNSNLQIKKDQLQDLAKSLEYNPKNPAALRLLTVLGFDKEVSEEALKIYNPHNATHTPWVVDFELGKHELEQKNFKKAVEYFRKARKKSPGNPQIIDKLAKTLLQQGDNLEEALSLVDQFATLPKGGMGGVSREEIISSFFDTRGLALMQMDRFEEAAAAFEIAFRSKSKDANIIKQLINCYQKCGNDRQAEAYQRRLARLEKDSSVKESIVPEYNK